MVTTKQSTLDNVGAGFNGPVARIVLSDGKSAPLNFDFNPQTVTMSRDTETHSPANKQSAKVETTVKISGNLLIELNGCRFIGANLEARMLQLFTWSKGVDTGGTSSGGQTNIELPPLTMTWGTTTRTVLLRKVDVTFEQYSPQGLPLAATAKLTLVDDPPQPPPQNPTSGGIPGRSSHVLVTGESLVGLATETYGSPRFWQALARANNIDDPLRMGAGREIYLPSPSEI